MLDMNLIEHSGERTIWTSNSTEGSNQLIGR